MITKRTLTIPIFEVRLTIVIFDEWEEAEKYSSDGIPCKGFMEATKSCGSAILAVDSHHEYTIVHECEHIKNFIWDYIGYNPQSDNDEVDAYLLKYIYKKVIEVFRKHVNSTN